MKGAPEGMPGAGPPRPLAVDRGIWAVVADAPLDRFSGEQFQQELQDLEAVSRHALAHASMIEFFFQRSPVIPLKLFTLFSRTSAPAVHLAGRGSKVRKMFERLRGLEEWGVRITASNRPVTVPSPSPGGPGAHGPASGRVLSGSEEAHEGRRWGAVICDETRGGGCAEGAWRSWRPSRARKIFRPLAAGGPMSIGASFLVKAKRRPSWKKRVAQLGASLQKQNHRLEVSGPWPPYHFVTDTKAAAIVVRNRANDDWLFPKMATESQVAESSLLDVIDNVLNHGVVLHGELILGVANVDLIYAKLSVLLAAMDKLHAYERGKRGRVPFSGRAGEKGTRPLFSKE